MRPWASADPDLIAGIRGVVFDIDDTVTRGGILEAPAFTAMHELADAGFGMVAVTGRPLGWADVLAGLWPLAAVVGENGAGWAWRVGRAVKTGYQSSETERQAHREVLDRIRDAVTREMPHVRVAGDQTHRRCDLAYDVGESVTLPHQEIERLVGIFEREGAGATVSSVHAHAVPGTWNKATGAAAAFTEVLGIDPQSARAEWVFVGDSGNDEAAFAWFETSVGVANVQNHLQSMEHPPRFVTRSDRGRGFAEVAAALLGR